MIGERVVANDVVSSLILGLAGECEHHGAVAGEFDFSHDITCYGIILNAEIVTVDVLDDLRNVEAVESACYAETCRNIVAGNGDDGLLDGPFTGNVADGSAGLALVGGAGGIIDSDTILSLREELDDDGSEGNSLSFFSVCDAVLVKRGIPVRS